MAIDIAAYITAAGVPCRKTRYPAPPSTAYAVYTDEQTVDGADGLMGCTLVQHGITIELYKPGLAPEPEAAIEGALLALGYPWTKQDAYWLQDVQRYQVVYEFTYYEKRRA